MVRARLYFGLLDIRSVLTRDAITVPIALLNKDLPVASLTHVQANAPMSMSTSFSIPPKRRMDCPADVRYTKYDCMLVRCVPPFFCISMCTIEHAPSQSRKKRIEHVCLQVLAVVPVCWIRHGQLNSVMAATALRSAEVTTQGGGDER